MELLVGTDNGVHRLGAGRQVDMEGHAVTALARAGDDLWAIVDGQSLWRKQGKAPWQEVARSPGWRLHCLLPSSAGLLVGTAEAHLLRLEDGGLVLVQPFEKVEGRGSWFTPWGGPPDTRSLAQDAQGTIYVNVHVGGIVRSRDEGRSWHPTIDIETDVHQVVVHEGWRGLVVAPCALGLAVSTDGGDSWQVLAEGLHGRYMRAAAVAEDVAVASASLGPYRGGDQRAALYRLPLEASDRLERCRHGLPEWFADNIDSHCLTALGKAVAFGTSQGEVYLSQDKGLRWEKVAEGLPPVRCLVMA
ncbi:MAG TPA: hypothetical protein VNL95_06280 [Dehalococcoidia bacterium]|nr:hypothetical protein [Dehalococcoidia bacterium]